MRRGSHSLTLHFHTIDEYLEQFPQDVRLVLGQVRRTIAQAAPEAQEAIAYNIPTFKLNGNLVHFAGYKHHIGFYPGAEAVSVFDHELQGLVKRKGTIQFALGEPVPFDLIKRIVVFRRQQQLAKRQK